MSSDTASANLSAVAIARGLRSIGSFTALTVSATQWANSAMRLSWSKSTTKAHRSATSRGICAAQRAWRSAHAFPAFVSSIPSAWEASIVLDRTDVENVGVRAAIEDLR